MVIFTSKSLMGQWEDEFKKNMPRRLQVVRHYGKDNKLKLKELATTDVIVSTPTKEWSKAFQTNYIFHRVVLDESHLLGSVSARLNVVTSLHYRSSWCATATPLTSSVSDLVNQAKFLGLEEELNNARLQFKVKDFIERHMLRHTKAQLIHGTMALVLPESTTETKEVDMTDWEWDTFCDRLWEKKQKVLRRFEEQTRIVEMSWYYALMGPRACDDSSKIEQLKLDLKALLEQEPNMRAVVFTQLRERHRFVYKALKGMGLKTYRFDGSASAEYRDRAIREFQDVSEEGPAVFAITMQPGSVGITLTTASHVFVLEPCVVPSREVQAAGRIHRLGQSKAVGMTKYYFDYSCESKILDLHKKIKAGSIEFSSGVLSREAMDVLRLRESDYFDDVGTYIECGESSFTLIFVHLKHSGLFNDPLGQQYAQSEH